MLPRDSSRRGSLAAFAKKRGINALPDEKIDTETAKADMKKQMDDMAALEKLGASCRARRLVTGSPRELLVVTLDHHAQVLAIEAGALETRKTMLQRHSDSAKELRQGNAQATK